MAGGTQLTPAEVTVTADVKPTLEDAEGGVKLSDLAKFTIEEGVGHSPRFSITLRNVPEGVEVVNMMKTTSDGETVWTAYGQGDQDALDDLVKSISLKLPDHWNSNEGNPGHGLKFEIDITSYVPGGDKSTASVEDLAPVITPDTDDPVIDISATGGNEGVVSVPINIKLTNDADDPNSTIKGADGGKIYIKLEGRPRDRGALV